MATVITNIGIAAVDSASSGGPKIDITTFKVGSAVGYTPLESMTSLQGSVLYSANVSNYTVLSNDMVEYECILDQSVGPFQFGEVGLYLTTGELFALTAFDTLKSKEVQNLGTGDLGNKIIIRIQLTMQNLPFVINFQDISLEQRLPWADDWQNSTFINSTTFTNAIDTTGLFIPGRRVRASLTTPIVYSYVKSSAFASGTTTVVLTDAVLTNNLTTVDYGIMEPGLSNAEAYIRSALKTIGPLCVTVSQVNPFVHLEETDGATNSKEWRLQVASNILKLSLFDDSFNPGADIFQISRNGTGAGTTLWNGSFGLGVAPTQTLDVNGNTLIRGGRYENGIATLSLSAGTFNNFDIPPLQLGGFTTWRVSTDPSGSAFGGIVPHFLTGEYHRIRNLGPGQLSFIHESSGSISSNRFNLPGGLSISILSGGVAEIWYDTISQRWIIESSGDVAPSGTIVMWDDIIANIPFGWVLCDGTNGTTDFRDRIPIGAGNTYSLRAAGGAAVVTPTINSFSDLVPGIVANGSHSHTTTTNGQHNHGGFTQVYILTINDMPSHNHTFFSGYSSSSSGSGIKPVWDGTPPATDLNTLTTGPFTGRQIIGSTGGNNGHNHGITFDGLHNHTTDTQGLHTHTLTSGGTYSPTANPISILPPYRAVYFIRKT